MRPPAKFEFEILRYLAEHDGLTVREIFEGFASNRGLTRGTVVKTMDRLLKKGLVERELVDGSFSYTAKQTSEEMVKMQVASFIQDRLGGSLKPIVAYLAEGEGFDPRELEELKRLVNDSLE